MAFALAGRGAADRGAGRPDIDAVAAEVDDFQARDVGIVTGEDQAAGAVAISLHHAPEPSEPPSIFTPLAVIVGRPEVVIVIAEAKPIEPEPSMLTCWMAERKVIVPLTVSPAPFAESSGRSLESSHHVGREQPARLQLDDGRSIAVPSNSVALGPTTRPPMILSHGISLDSC